ncbi:hypothetical protein BGZ89_009541 [Linnemannia elongata]|nr:hypothetical protein BGZ89_009541 [Linnemannia elongata]
MEPDLTPLGSPPHHAQPTTTFRSTACQSITNSVFAGIGRATDGVAQPSLTANDRSIGFPAIVAEGTLVPSDQVSGNAGGDADDDSDSQHNRKRDKLSKVYRSSSSERKMIQARSFSPKATYGDDIDHEVSCSLDIEHAVSTTEVKSHVSNVQSLSLPAKPRLAGFLQNVNPPVVHISLPELGSRIDTTPQLALCISLLPKGSGPINQDESYLQVLSSGTASKLAWLDAMKQDTIEQERLRWLGARMVDEFSMGPSKNSTKIAEMMLIGPMLDNEHYRRLLSCTITALDQAVLLDVDLLQGLVQLVQSAPSEALLPDDLVKILRVLRVRLQDTHQQSSVYPFHLTLAVSRLLDVMAEHKVKDLDRVEEHEPLSGVLSGMKTSSDPYLMYQACYAFQALQYVPNNESPLQAVLRHSTGVVDGLVKVSAVFKLDLGAVLEGLGKLQEALCREPRLGRQGRRR